MLQAISKMQITFRDKARFDEKVEQTGSMWAFWRGS